VKNRTILILDDDPGVSRLMGNAVREAGREPVCFARAADALHWLRENRPELMLLDNVLADMNAVAFLDQLEQAAISVPFVITTGQGNELLAVELMKRGALDYLVKDADFLDQLPAALQRTLRVVETQHRLADVEQALRQFRTETRAILEAAADGIVTFDAAGTIVTANSALREMYGFTEAELANLNITRLLTPADGGALPQYPTRASTNEAKRQLRTPREFVALRADGLTFDAEVTFSEIEGSSQRLYLAIIRDISEKRRVQRQLMHDALHDKLTGLPNRAQAAHRIQHLMGLYADRPGSHCAVVFVDLDRFKLVNDSMGHAAGDLMLVEVSRRLGHLLRPVDLLARIASDEFVIILDDVRELSSAVDVGRRVLAALEPEIPVRGARIKTNASIGIAMSQAAETDAEELLRRADLAMNRAKENGRGRIEVFDKDMHARTAMLMRLEIELRHAIGTDQILNYYQPVVNVDKGRVAGFEALVRWQQNGKGMVSPAEFIPLAEETGLICALGSQVLRNACRQNRLWHDRFGQPTVVSVNLSARQLVSDNVVQLVREVLADTGLPASSLKLELTESAFIDYQKGDLGALDELRAMGVGLAIDDFGTGYSSFGYLGKLPIETIKVDRTFVQGLPDKPDNVAITSAILALARAMNINTVVEGVENAAQLRFLRERGCRWVQGYLFSKPLPADAATEFLARPVAVPD
jgi:diguanylate cyclase (GGDEF)-like protein/PAS domain S-box-containing protein